jgi:hypothetical protein
LVTSMMRPRTQRIIARAQGPVRKSMGTWPETCQAFKSFDQDKVALNYGRFYGPDERLGGLGFRDVARAPLFLACSMKCLSACVDKMTIANSGSDALISRAASIPFRTGMVMFITTTSGLSRCASSTAAAPSWASPQSSNRGWESNICRTLFLITGWSSATRIRRRRPGATVGLVRSAPRAIPKSRRGDGKAPYSRASTAKGK